MTYYLNPVDLSLYGNAILALLGAVYLHLRRDKPPESKWLYLALYFLSLTFLCWTSGFDIRSEIHLLKILLSWISHGFWLAFLIVFIYQFKGDFFPTERKIVSVVAFMIPVLESIQTLRYYFGSITIQNIDILPWMGAAFTVVALVVAWRKRQVCLKQGEEKDARALNAMCLAISGWVLFIFWNILTQLMSVSPEIFLIGFALFTTLFVLVLILTYIHHAGIEFSVLSKLVVVSLGGIAFIMTVVIQVTFPKLEEYHGSNDERLITNNESVHFKLAGSGGYQRHQKRSRALSSYGTEIEIEYLQYHSVDLSFSFPFFSESYDRVFVSEYGVVKFFSPGERRDLQDPIVSKATHFRNFWSDHPTISPFYSSSRTVGSRVFVGESDSSLVVTWQLATKNISDSESIVQVVLSSSGAIDFNYQWSDDPLNLPSYRGIVPGDVDEIPESHFFNDNADSTYVVGAPVVESDLASFGQQGTEYSRPLFGFMFLLFAITIFGSPLLFRRTLLRPLERLTTGIQQIEDGNLDSRVEVETLDEFGRLSMGFNNMASSLSTAKDELQAHADELEQKVEERTADLEGALSDLKATQSQLVQQEKLASLGSLTAGIAHEIKNPLNFVNNFAEVSVEMTREIKEAIKAGNLEEASSILDEMEENSDQIAKHGKRADSIVRSMMQHARGGTSVRENVDVAAFLEENINLAWHGRRAKDQTFQAEVIRDFTEDLGEARIQPMEMGRVILNLLNNAFDAVSSAEGGKVTVKAARSEDEVTISVLDNGPGIPEDIREKIFEPFFTTKETGEGTGLGLSMSHDIVTKGHGGRLTVDQASGSGAMFTIILRA